MRNKDNQISNILKYKRRCPFSVLPSPHLLAAKKEPPASEKPHRRTLTTTSEPTQKQIDIANFTQDKIQPLAVEMEDVSQSDSLDRSFDAVKC